MSRDFIDAKAALAEGDALRIACEAMLEAADQAGVVFQAVGGLTLGADQFAHVIAVLAHKSWFVVRKEAKGRGTNQLVEGTRITPGLRVLLVDDVVTSGGSIQRAYEQVTALGATVVGAVTLVDRGEIAASFFEALDVPYRRIVSYSDLGIDPIDDRAPTA